MVRFYKILKVYFRKNNNMQYVNQKLFYVLFIISVSANAQVTKDTLYIDKKANQVIFIDTPHSKFHNLVFYFLLSDMQEFANSKTDSYQTNNFNSNYYGEWITVKKFKGKYFAYHPSEPFYNTLFKFSDSLLLINDFNEGFISYVINKKKVKKKRLQLNLVGYEGIRHLLSIKQKSRKLLIVKSSLFKEKKLYFTRRSNYYDYPIIVNYCPTNRCQEFNFK